MGKLSTVQECVFDVNVELHGVVENLLGLFASVDGFEHINKLPLSQIPEDLRKNDPSLKYQAMYEIRSNEQTQYKILLGEHTIGITLNAQGTYTSWTDSFYPEIKKIFSKIFKSGRIKKIDRMGLRYIDFIENDNIFDDGKISVNINNNNACDKKMFLRVEDIDNGVAYVKSVSNNTSYINFKDTGSIIDIVTAIENKNLVIQEDFNIETLFSEIDSLHTTHTNKFKEVINDKYIKQYQI